MGENVGNSRQKKLEESEENRPRSDGVTDREILE